MPICTDEFFCDNSFITNTDESTSQNCMSPLVNLMRDFLSNKQTNLKSLEATFFEDNSSIKVNSIDVNDQALWICSDEYLDLVLLEDNISEINKHKAQFKSALQSFIKVENESHKKIVFLLNRNLLMAVWAMLNINYVFGNKMYHYTNELPPSRLSTLRLQRVNNQLKLIFTSRIKSLFEPMAQEHFGLNNQNQLFHLKDLNLCSGDMDICTVYFECNIDLSPENVQPKIYINLKISSECQWFRYRGGWADGVKKLENIDRSVISNRSRYSCQVSPARDEIFNEITKLNIELGILINNIICYKDPGSNVAKFCNELIKLFNISLKITLLKQLSSQTNIDTPSGLERVHLTLINLQNVAVSKLNSSHNDNLLFEEVFSELSEIFYNLHDQMIVSLIMIFNKPIINQLHQRAKFINQNTRTYLGPMNLCKDNNIDRVFILTYIIAVSCETINGALQKVKELKHFDIFGLPAFTNTQITSIYNIHLGLGDYIKTLCRNKIFSTERSPLSEQVLDISSEKLPDINTINFINTEPNQYTLENNIKDPAIVLQHVSMPESYQVLRCCPMSSYPPEKVAALFMYNPAVKGFNDGCAVYFNLSQLMSVYPDLKIAAIPYLILTNIIAGSIGTWIGRQLVLYPNESKAKPAFLIWDAFTGGLVVSVFDLGTAINFYLTLKPNTDYVSEYVFWGEMAPVPLLFSAIYITWNAMPYKLKEQYFARNNTLVNINKLLDVFTKFLFYGGVSSISIMNLFKVHNISAVLIAAGVSGIVSIGHLSRFKERINLFMVYTTYINFLYMLIKDIASGEIAKDTLPRDLTYAQISFWLAAMLASTYFIIKNSLSFVKEYSGSPEIVVQVLPKDSPELFPDKSMSFISLEQYKRIQSAEETGGVNQLLQEAETLIPLQEISMRQATEYTPLNLHRKHRSKCLLM